MRLREWATAELRLWSDLSPRGTELVARLEAHARRHPTVFLMRISGSRVLLDDKADWDPPVHARDPIYPSVLHRAQEYAAFFTAALSRFGVVGDGMIAIDVRDVHSYEPDIPVFAFQRRYGSRFILVPDIEFITSDFYVDDRYRDVVEPSAKREQAIFVGSTTGAALNADMVRTLDHTRLRSAVFFKDREDVVYELPAILQYDGPVTYELIAALDVAGRRRSWAEQLEYRYILSVDGNGATCSRLVLALASNSVPAKYVSNHELYYFRGLRPFRHYIPIDRDQDVIALLESRYRDAELHDGVMRESRTFSERTFPRIHVMRYVAEVISAYLQDFGTGTPVVSRDFMIDAFVHRAGVGTRWLDAAPFDETVDHPIEGFGLVPGEEIDPADLFYGAVDEAGILSPMTGASGFCGTRGQGRPLHGLSVALRGDAAVRHVLDLEAVFADGSVLYGGLVFSRDAPLIDFRLVVRPR